MELLLKNISWSYAGKDITADVRISKGLISGIGNLSPLKKEKTIDFRNHFLYPGLVNAHDHLEMNLYPRMGKPPYHNYLEWARDIHKPRESPVKEIEQIDIKDRLVWGGIKNLISGATTVVHHNPWHRILSKDSFPVHVKETAWAHSLAAEKRIQTKFPKSKQVPFVVHAAEGIDEFAELEIERLSKLNLLKENTVLVHAIAMSDKNFEMIQQINASVVWCPSSNHFMFNRTAPINQLKSKIKISLGTDSTMTGAATLLDEMRIALNTEMATTDEVIEMVTTTSAKIFNLATPGIHIGNSADLIICPKDEKDYSKNLLAQHAANLTAVLVSGEIRCTDSDVAEDIGSKGNRIKLNGKEKWFCVDVSKLIKRIDRYKIDTFLSRNPLWQMFSV